MLDERRRKNKREYPQYPQQRQNPFRKDAKWKRFDI